VRLLQTRTEKQIADLSRFFESPICHSSNSGDAVGEQIVETLAAIYSNFITEEIDRHEEPDSEGVFAALAHRL
jgi:hypothetical protein